MGATFREHNTRINRIRRVIIPIIPCPKMCAMIGNSCLLWPISLRFVCSIIRIISFIWLKTAISPNQFYSSIKSTIFIRFLFICFMLHFYNIIKILIKVTCDTRPNEFEQQFKHSNFIYINTFAFSVFVK